MLWEVYGDVRCCLTTDTEGRSTGHGSSLALHMLQTTHCS